MLSLHLVHFGCIPYLFHIGTEQARILWHREKIETVISDKKLTDDSIAKLRLIQNVKEFATSKLALNQKGGFVYFTQLAREEIGWNVSASDPLAFESYTWWFPIAGKVPYKGFFKEELAKIQESDLKANGLDTRIRVIGGYSTLGWFSDPVLSPQLKWKEYRLVGLVFHELAHATAYLPGDSDLNESYASFVEEKSLEIYYKTFEGEKSKSLKEARLEKFERNEIIELLRSYSVLLEKVYKSELNREEKLQNKERIINEFKEEAIKKKMIPKDKIQSFRKREWNNEDFLGVMRYHSGESSFEALFVKVDGDFKKFHEEVRKLFKLSEEERKQFLAK